MIVMPSNGTGWYWHSLARETGRLGHLHSPGHQRGPWPWFPYAIDNGCYSLWTRKTNFFDEQRWLAERVEAWRHLIFWTQAAPVRPLWGIVPDRPGNWTETEKKWPLYAAELITARIPLAVAVQDGATPALVRKLRPVPHVIAIGGSDEFKWPTAEMWLGEFERVHMLRCNIPEKLDWLEARGCMSCDGTGWNRGDRDQTRGLEEWARSRGVAVNEPLWPYASRAEPDPKQKTFA